MITTKCCQKKNLDTSFFCNSADSADADGKASNIDALLAVSKPPLGCVSPNEGFDESRGVLELEGDFGKPDLDFNFVVLLLGDGLLVDFGGGLLAAGGDLFGKIIRMFTKTIVLTVQATFLEEGSASSLDSQSSLFACFEVVTCLQEMKRISIKFVIDF